MCDRCNQLAAKAQPFSVSSRGYSHPRAQEKENSQSDEQGECCTPDKTVKNHSDRVASSARPAIFSSNAFDLSLNIFSPLVPVSFSLSLRKHTTAHFLV